MKYTRQEDVAMMRYIAENDWWRQTAGMRVWSEMEAKEVVLLTLYPYHLSLSLSLHPCISLSHSLEDGDCFSIIKKIKNNQI